MAISKIINNVYLIESGTDKRWHYRKWSDGTAECWASFTDSVSGTQHHFNGHFPITFIETPAMTASGGNNSNINSSVRYAFCTTTDFDIYVVGDWANTGFVQVYVIGKWK